MKISLSGNQITITPREEGIILIIDGGNNKALAIVKAIYDEIQSQTKEYNISFKLGVLSYGNELFSVSELDQLNMGKKGRFITPLVDGFFQDVKDKEFDLLILYSGMIYDYSDWEKFLFSKFNNVYPPIDVEKELKTKTHSDLSDLKDGLISKLFGRVIDEALINFDSQSVPCHFSENLLLQFDPDKRVFCLRYPKIKEDTLSKKVTIEIWARSYKDESSFMAQVGGAKFDGKIRNDKFTQPVYKSLPHEDLEIFKNHMDVLQRANNTEIKTYCPLCQKDGTFYKPFFCQSKRRYILDLVDSLAKEKQKMFLFINREFKLLLSPREILEYEEGKFVFVGSEEKVYEIKCIKNDFVVKELPRSFHSLYKMEDGGFVMLWI